MKVTLTAPRDRQSTLVSVPLPESAEPSGPFTLNPLSGPSEAIVAEPDPEGRSLSFPAPPMKKGDSISFEVRPAPSAGKAPGIIVQRGEGRMDVSLAGSPFFTFHHGKQYPKPVINPILTPGGTNMLREPMEAYGQGEHPWQRGLTLMQGAINGIDAWNERDDEKHGRTEQDSMEVHHGPLSLVIASSNTWYAKDRPLMTDRRYYRLFDTSRNAAVLDVSITLRATHGDLTLGGTKEAGFLCLRVNPTMNAADRGSMENSYGATDETGCWSKPAHWVDYYGPVGSETAGFAIFDNPSNLRYPTTWHVRGYGLFAPNCWMFRPEHGVKSGDELTFRWRVTVHTGDTASAGIRERFLDYVDGPRAKWE